jgi:hypothetical protein
MRYGNMKRRTKHEEKLYAPVMKALEKKFSLLGECYFEDTSEGFSEKMKGELEDEPLFLFKTRGMRPDLTGFLIDETFNIIVVEVKDELKLDDIYQTKKYAETLNASYALLVSPKELTQEIRRFLINRKGQITKFLSSKQLRSFNEHVLIGSYNDKTETIQFDTELYDYVELNTDKDKKHYDVIFKR